jgi:hypothetical protein
MSNLDELLVKPGDIGLRSGYYHAGGKRCKGGHYSTAVYPRARPCLSPERVKLSLLFLE